MNIRKYFQLLKAGLGNINFCLNSNFNLDIHVSEHCNLNCKGCTHFSPIAEKEFVDINILNNSLELLSPFYKTFNAIQLLGGEPLLNPEIVSILKITRKHFPYSKINLFTNGILLQNPNKLPQNLWYVLNKNSINIKITRYPIKLDLEFISKLCEENKVNLEVCNDEEKHSWFQFRLIPKGNDVYFFRYKWLKLMRCHTYHCIQLVRDRLYPCPHSAYVRHLVNKFDLKCGNSLADSLPVKQIKNNRDIRKFMIKTIPFCKYCGEGYKPDIWAPSKYKLDEWAEL